MRKLLVTVSEAAEILSLSTKKVYDLAAAGEIDKAYIGAKTRNFRLTVVSLERYVDSLSADPIEATA